MAKISFFFPPLTFTDDVWLTIAALVEIFPTRFFLLRKRVLSEHRRTRRLRLMLAAYCDEGDDSFWSMFFTILDISFKRLLVRDYNS